MGNAAPAVPGAPGSARARRCWFPHQCQIWEIAFFSLLSSGPEAAERRRAPRCAVPLRGEAGAGQGDPATLAEQTGTGARWSPSGNCCLPGGLGGAEGLPCGSAVVIIYEVLEAAWGELYFHLHVKRYHCQ